MTWYDCCCNRSEQEKKHEVLCLCDVFQNIKDEFHDDGALTELAGPSMDHWHQSAVQVIHVLRGKGLAIAPCLIANLYHREKDDRLLDRAAPSRELRAKEAEQERDGLPGHGLDTQQLTQTSLP